MTIFDFRRWLALTIKEFQQIKKNKQLLFQLIVPPSIALVIFGLALTPEVKHLRMGVVDESQTQASRDLLRQLTANQAFDIAAYYPSQAQIADALGHRRLDLAVVIPEDYARRPKTEVQVLIDAVNANTANLAQGYLLEAMMSGSPTLPVEGSSKILFNPGSVHSWYFVTGIISLLIFNNGALLAAALTVREKELGTIEQLLMSPAQTFEILLAKTAPVVAMMMVVLSIGTVVGMAVFDLPLRGSFFLLGLSAALAAIAGIGMGITVATFSSSQQQAQLLTFFLMPPLTLISGAFGAIEGMPKFLQYVSMFDPLRYMVKMVRGIMIKGSGLDVLWPQLLTLAVFSFVLYGVSALRFRRQLR